MKKEMATMTTAEIATRIFHLLDKVGEMALRARKAHEIAVMKEQRKAA